MAEHHSKGYNSAMAEGAARVACETRDDKTNAAAMSGAAKTEHALQLSSKLPVAASHTESSLESQVEKLNRDLEKQRYKRAKLVREYNDLVARFDDKCKPSMTSTSNWSTSCSMAASNLMQHNKAICRQNGMKLLSAAS